MYHFVDNSLFGLWLILGGLGDLGVPDLLIDLPHPCFLGRPVKIVKNMKKKA